MSPGVTHLAVDARLRTSRPPRMGARTKRARRMVRPPTAPIELATSVASIRHYVRALLEEYTGAMADGGAAPAGSTRAPSSFRASVGTVHV